MIPEAKTAAVGRALQEAFGVNEFEDIRVLTAGLSIALVFLIVVHGNQGRHLFPLHRTSRAFI